MDFFEELGKQTAKLMNNFTETVSELSSFATDSAESLSNAVIDKGKLENLKFSLNKLYRDLGEKYAEDPTGDYSKLVEQANDLKTEIKKLQEQIASFKESVTKTSSEIKDKALENSKELLNNLKLDTKEVYDETKSIVSEEKDKAENQIDQNMKSFKSGFNEEFNK